MSKLSNIAIAIDCEYDENQIIEIGITEINLAKRRIIRTISIPVWKEEVTPRIAALTGWTTKKLHRAAVCLEQCKEYPDKRYVSGAEAVRKLNGKYGLRNRLIITDADNELDLIKLYLTNENGFWFEPSQSRVNVHILGQLMGFDGYRPLEETLSQVGLKFEGKPHRASTDSLNIARYFLALLDRMDNGSTNKTI